MKKLKTIGFGGGCHWCTEAVFQVVKGVDHVEQGYISTRSKPETFYEGVIVHYYPEIVCLKTLIQIHLQTHNSTSNHSMRSKYLSAIYMVDTKQERTINEILKELQIEYKKEIVTKAYFLGEFKASRKEIRNYYKTDPERPFCKAYILPKLKSLEDNFEKFIK